MPSLSTHVLDTALGRPAAGVRVELTRAGEPVASAETDADGRAASPRTSTPGTYRLAFSPPSPFFTRVELEIVLDDGHYHVPLLDQPVRMRELPRQLTADELAELFEGRTRFVERLAAERDPLDARAHARARASGSTRRRRSSTRIRRSGSAPGSPRGAPPSRDPTTTPPCSPSSRA